MNWRYRIWHICAALILTVLGMVGFGFLSWIIAFLVHYPQGMYIASGLDIAALVLPVAMAVLLLLRKKPWLSVGIALGYACTVYAVLLWSSTRYQ